MKIELNGPATSQLPSESVGSRVSGSGTSSTQNSAEDRITFHSDGASIQSFTSQALRSPEVRQSTVQSLRQSVSSGQYNVDTARTANAIVSNQ
jgi:flagellar biosynthesis anti-sigma factor FlgM